MKEWLKRAYRRYIIDALSAMGLGLFASLIIGLILSQLAQISWLSFLAPYCEVLSASSPVVGAAIGVAIGYGLKVKPLAIFSCAAAGAFGYQMAGPVGAYLAAVVGAELGGLVAGRTKVDIIVVPTVVIVAGGLVTDLTAAPINAGIAALQRFLESATAMQPVPMGIIVSVVFGLALTAPISSAALAAMVFTVPEGGEMGMGLQLAAGAATVGCCAQMVGFAVSSFRENGVSGLIAQGLGTSMLQVGNILKAPAILIPPTLASAILGPLATTVLGRADHQRRMLCRIIHRWHGHLRAGRPVRHMGGHGRRARRADENPRAALHPAGGAVAALLRADAQEKLDPSRRHEARAGRKGLKTSPYGHFPEKTPSAPLNRHSRGAENPDT